MSELGRKAVALAAQSVGVREETPNWGRWVSVYLRFVGLMFPAAWCCAFVCYKVHEAARELNIQTDFPRSGKASYSCTALYRWAVANGRILEKPERGCVFLIRDGDIYRHTGFVERVLEGGIVQTVEGNTNAGGSAEGDGVYRRERSKNLVFVRV